MKQVVLILGGTGFIGRALAATCNSLGLESQFDFISVSHDGIGESIWGKNLKADLLKGNVLHEILSEFKPHIILNLVGSSSVCPDLDQALLLNLTIPTLICTYYEKQAPPQAIVFVGSAAEYGTPDQLPIMEDTRSQPESFYGLSKVMQTELAKFYFRKFALPIRIVRPFNLVGEQPSGKIVMGSFLKKLAEAKNGTTLQVGDLSIKRDFIAVQDVASAIWKVATLGKNGETYNICSNESIALDEMLHVMLEASGKRLQIIASELGFAPSKRISEVRGSYDKLQQETGWQPMVSILSELKRIVEATCRNELQ